MPILDGRGKADQLPPAVVGLLNSYGDELGRVAVQAQRDHGTPLTELLACIIVDDECEVAGVAKTADVVAEFLDLVQPKDKEPLDAFLERPIGPTQVRLVVWSDAGLALLRIDTMPPAQGDQA